MSWPKDRPIITHCQSGARATVAVSALSAAGFDNVLELEGGYVDWKKSQNKVSEAVAA